MSEHEYASMNKQLDWKKAKVIVAGVDVGAVSSKAVILLDGQPYAVSHVATRTPKESALKAINAALAKTGLTIEKIQYIVGTGRGRTQVPFARKTYLKLRAAPRGGTHLGPIRAYGARCRGSKLQSHSLHRKGQSNRLSSGTTNALRALGARWKHLPIW